MAKTPAQSAAYKNQRQRITPPHVALGDLRVATGMTIDQLLDRLQEITGHRYMRGTISAVENGLRRPSSDLLDAIATAYGLRSGAVTTSYEPRGREVAA